MSINYAPTNKLRHIQINIVSCQFNLELSRCSEMRVKKKWKFRRGWEVFTNPSGMEILRGWGVKNKNLLWGGYAYFMEIHVMIML